MAEQAFEKKSEFSDLSVVSGQSSFDPGMVSGSVVIECSLEPQKSAGFRPAIEKLSSSSAKKLALIYAAQQGMADPRVNGIINAPYAVDFEGEEIQQSDGIPREIKAYRVSVPVARGFVA